mgnify:CR=1 FL=1
MAKKLFLIRHTNYDFLTGKINNQGIQRIKQELTPKIINYTNQKVIHWITSPKRRAIDTALTLADNMQIKDLTLNTTNTLLIESEQNYQELYQILQQKNPENIIAISHKEIVEGLPHYLHKKHGWEKQNKTKRHYCQGHYIDFEMKKCLKYPEMQDNKEILQNI